MKLQVLLLDEYDDDWVRRLRAELDPGIVLTCGDGAAAPTEYNVLVAGVPKREHLTASDRLHT